MLNRDRQERRIPWLTATPQRATGRYPAIADSARQRGKIEEVGHPLAYSFAWRLKSSKSRPGLSREAEGTVEYDGRSYATIERGGILSLYIYIYQM